MTMGDSSILGGELALKIGGLVAGVRYIARPTIANGNFVPGLLSATWKL
jgi:hypothetical protein